MIDGAGRDVSAWEVDLGRRERPGFTVDVELCTWDVVVFRVTRAGGGPPVYVGRSEADVRGFLRDLDLGRRDADLARAVRGHGPRRRLRRAPRTPAVTRLGLEHEYRVHGPEGLVDVRAVIDDLPLGIRADPTDPHAARGPWGGVVTADGAEAEVATPPVVVGPGAVADVVALAAAGRAHLAAGLGPGRRLEGYSTHLNVSAPRRGERSRAALFARTFAPALMLLLDRRTSPGLLVRPRPGRLELGGDFADGADLEVALTFALGATLALRGARDRRRVRRLEVELVAEPARERFGWYVDRRAAGHDLYDLGRAAPLRRSPSGETVTAGRHLVEAWEVARSRLDGVLHETELAPVDAVVGSGAALPRLQEGNAS